MDRFEEMAMFQIIARTGTISATANELSVAPSAVSRRLKALEDRLGVHLVQRTTRKLTLTPAGESYLQGAQRILSQLDELEGEVQAGSGTLTGPLRLTAPLSFALIFLPDILDGFMRQHPGVKLDLHMTDARVDLVAEGFDLALRIGRLDNSSLIAKKLCAIDFALCASPAFLKEHGTPDRPEDLAGKPGCIYTNEAQGATLKWTSPEGEQGHINLETVFRANNGDILRELAGRGHGLVCAPKFIVQTGLDTGALVQLFEGYTWGESNLYAVYPPTPHMPARLRALIDYLAGALKR